MKRLFKLFCVQKLLTHPVYSNTTNSIDSIDIGFISFYQPQIQVSAFLQIHTGCTTYIHHSPKPDPIFLWSPNTTETATKITERVEKEMMNICSASSVYFEESRDLDLRLIEQNKPDIYRIYGVCNVWLYRVLQKFLNTEQFK